MSGVKGETPINRHKIPSVEIYEVTEAEIMELSSKNGSGLYLNFAICCISIDATLLAALLTCDASDIVQVIFISLIVVLSLATIFLGILWYKEKNKYTKTLEKILNRH